MKHGKLTKSEAGRLGALAKAQRIREEYEKSPKQCAGCESLLEWEKRHNKFCSQSCAATNNNKGVRRHGSPSRLCEGCGKETRNPLFCSNQCQRDHEWELTKQEIESTGIFPRSNRVIKRYLTEKNGTVCAICKGTEWMGKPMPLEVDHINGHWKDDRVENVRMVCGNCGMQLPTYKNKNRGNGRHLRRQRYSEGKSY